MYHEISEIYIPSLQAHPVPHNDGQFASLKQFPLMNALCCGTVLFHYPEMIKIMPLKYLLCSLSLEEIAPVGMRNKPAAVGLG